MKKSTFLSVVSVLLAFSVISHARTYVQQQDPKPVQQTNQQSSVQPNLPAVATQNGTTANPTNSKPVVTEAPSTGISTTVDKVAENIVVPGQNYTATAYSLRGRTASGKAVARGVIAADPRFLPIGTRVRVDAGLWSGEYVVADTGGSVKGHRIDIWTPTAGEALRFGRRLVKLTILELGGKRSKNASVRTRSVNSPNASSSTEQANKQ
ncbi:MAG TPA: 3D domain-containing protein [Pyrinomonadaceae bacterium]|nr:3D domain-containing protein [Pyrinomonadaceae bacterium]